jgi:hypothetical protein
MAETQKRWDAASKKEHRQKLVEKAILVVLIVLALPALVEHGNSVVRTAAGWAAAFAVINLALMGSGWDTAKYTWQELNNPIVTKLKHSAYVFLAVMVVALDVFGVKTLVEWIN